MSHYSEYVKEREGFETLEISAGFATYLIQGQECYIRDIYVKPELRKDNVASLMADKISLIAKEKGCRYLLGTVSPVAKGATESLKVLVNYGFKILKSDTQLIYFVKEL